MRPDQSPQPLVDPRQADPPVRPGPDELAAEARRLCTALAAGLRTGSGVQRQTAALRRVTRRWVDAGVSLPDARDAIRAGVDQVSARMVSDLPVRDRTALADGMGLVVDLMAATSAAVYRAYEHQLHDELSDQLDAERLLAPGPARPQAGPAPDPCYVLAVRAHVAAAEQWFTALHTELRNRCPAKVLAIPQGPVGTFVIAAPELADSSLDRLVADAAAAAGVIVTGTVVHAPPAQVAAARHRAHELLELLRTSAYRPGLYRFDDLALEYQLTRPTPLRERLASMLDPLDDHRDLMATLTCLLRHDLNRSRTARELNIHLNTVDYRLRRIYELTGHNPASSTDLWRLRCALIARSGRSGRAAAQQHEQQRQ